MFDSPEYCVIRREGLKIPPEYYKFVDFVFLKKRGVLCDDICNDFAALYSLADAVVVYSSRLTLGFGVELGDMWLGDFIMDEINDWCYENLEEYNMISGEVLRNRLGLTSPLFPIFEMRSEEDAMAFKLRWA